MRSGSPLRVVDSSAPIDLAYLQEIYNPVDLQRLLDLFINTSDSTLDKIREHLQKKDRITVAGLAHELKASSASVGSKKMAKLCLCLEQAAGQEDWFEAEETFHALSELFVELKSFVFSVEINA